MRSKLFVPASRPELFEKAMLSRADAICFDLEDAVLESRKAEAREILATFLYSDRFQSLKAAQGKTIIVRTNALATGHLSLDLHAACIDGVDIINLPKTDTAAGLLECIQLLEAHEQQSPPRQDGTHSAIRILANIETPQAWLNAAQIAGSHPRVWGLQLGLGDLFEPLAIDRHDEPNVHHIMLGMRIAAGTAGRIAYDSAYTHVDDIEGFREEARRARRAGYLGKTCIHPRQVDLANEVFSPTEEEIRWAEQVVLSAEQHTENGAYMLAGRMIDAPFIERARAVLQQAEAQRARGR